MVSMERNNGAIAIIGSSGTVGVGLGEAEVELAGIVIVCIALMSLVPTR